MSTLAWKRRLGRLQAVLPRSSNRRVVLLYHSIGDSPWAVTEAQFRSQMQWLARNTRVEQLDGLLEDEATAGLRVAITFDDGYASLADLAAGILRDAGMSATVYLNTSLIDESGGRASNPAIGHYPGETFLTWAGVSKLRDCDWTLGSHGMQHVDLTALPADRIAAELAGSRQCLETRYGTPCRHFAYTWGRNDATVRAAVREAGYQFAAAAVHGPIPRAPDRFALPRINVHHDYTLDDFAAIVRGDWDFLGVWQAWRSRRH
jgi:peptidoglycan/xylan/chitin deacetylase (PgdA/CDA1 family)